MPLLLGVVALLLGGGAFGAPAAGGAARAPAAASQYHGNVSITSEGPGVAVPAGTTLSIVYELEDPTFSPAVAGLYVHVPSSVGVFNTTNGTLRVPLAPKIVTLVSPNWTAPGNTTFNSTLVNATTFPSSGAPTGRHAVFSSQQVALSSPLPDGSWTVYLRWRWSLQPILGQNVSGPWEPSPNGTPVLPAETATLANPLPASVPPGSTLTVCLAGPISNRTFSLRVFQQDPTLLLEESNGTAPVDLLTSFCLAVTVPSWVPPEVLLVELWDQPNLTSNGSQPPTYLLYSLKIPVMAASPPPPTLFGYPREEVELAGGLVLLGLVVLAAALLVRRRSRRRRPPPRPFAVPSGAAGPVGSGTVAEPKAAHPPP